MKEILVVEADPSAERTWRFGRVGNEGDAVDEACGLLELGSNGELVLRRSHPDAITATLLLRRAGAEEGRIVYRFPQPSGTGALERHPSAAYRRLPRATAGRAKGGSGESLAERAERLRGPKRHE